MAVCFQLNNGLQIYQFFVPRFFSKKLKNIIRNFTMSNVVVEVLIKRMVLLLWHYNTQLHQCREACANVNILGFRLRRVLIPYTYVCDASSYKVVKQHTYTFIIAIATYVYDMIMIVLHFKYLQLYLLIYNIYIIIMVLQHQITITDHLAV